MFSFFKKTKATQELDKLITEIQMDMENNYKDLARQALEELKQKFILDNLNNTFEVLIEEFENGYSVGYTENYIKVYIDEKLKNKKYKVLLTTPFKEGALAKR